MVEMRPDDPVLRRLEEAPAEDEEISTEEEVAVQEALDEIAKGSPLFSRDEIRRELGIE